MAGQGVGALRELVGPALPLVKESAIHAALFCQYHPVDTSTLPRTCSLSTPSLEHFPHVPSARSCKASCHAILNKNVSALLRAFFVPYLPLAEIHFARPPFLCMCVCVCFFVFCCVCRCVAGDSSRLRLHACNKRGLATLRTRTRRITHVHPRTHTHTHTNTTHVHALSHPRACAAVTTHLQKLF